MGRDRDLRDVGQLAGGVVRASSVASGTTGETLQGVIVSEIQAVATGGAQPGQINLDEGPVEGNRQLFALGQHRSSQVGCCPGAA